ncbi:MAG: hypothetical protein HYS13_00210 [Planctomycetia bacterium]|nr:hypothetical protein [Planctomycetia bacterium]
MAKATSKTAKRSRPAAKRSPKAAKKPGRAKPRARKKRISLGRPLVTAEEMLFMLFKDDYPAREAFRFLNVQTVGELERYSPDEIVKRLAKPVFDTVDRIRVLLAAKNRSLAGDEEFALEHRAKEEK